MLKSNKQIQLTLPRPHLAQQQVINEAKRFSVVCCGRRWGKTQLAIDRTIQKALHGQPCGWFSPTYKMLADSWRTLCQLLDPVIADKSESEKRIQLRGGGVVECWSMDSAGDAARGRKYALVCLDEAAVVPNLAQAFESSIRPMLGDLRGAAWLLSTPRGTNDFKTFWDRGQDPLRVNWRSWQMPTSSSPIVTAAEIAEAKLDLSEATFAQEYLAQFVQWEGSVFRNLLACATAVPLEGPIAGHEYVIGVDWSRTNDYTVFVVLDARTHEMVSLDRSNRIDYIVQRGRLQALADKWKPRRILCETNSIGEPIVEELQRSHLPVEGFTTTASSKKEIIEALALAFEKGDIKILDDPVLMGELQSFTAERLPGGGLRYATPGNSHDDCVLALAIGWSAIGGPLREPHHGLFDLWREEAQKIRDENKPGAIVTRGGPKPSAAELATAQKDASNFGGHIPTFGRKPVPAAEPDLCPTCSAVVSRFAQTWQCNACGAGGTYAAWILRRIFNVRNGESFQQKWEPPLRRVLLQAGTPGRYQSGFW